MKNLTIYFKDGQVHKMQDQGTIPQLQKKYVIGTAMSINNHQVLTIDALTIQ